MEFVPYPKTPRLKRDIAYHTASKQNYKVLLENDELPKGLTQ